MFWGFFLTENDHKSTETIGCAGIMLYHVSATCALPLANIV